MSSTAVRRVFAVRWTGYEAIEEVLMPIRITPRDKGVISMQDVDISGIMAVGRRDALASYTDS